MKPPTCFYVLAMFRLVMVDTLNFLVNRPWSQNVSLLQNFEVTYTFTVISWCIRAICVFQVAIYSVPGTVSYVIPIGPLFRVSCPTYHCSGLDQGSLRTNKHNQ